MVIYLSVPLQVEDMEKLVSRDLYTQHMNFITSIQELKADEPVIMLLLLIVLFTSEKAGVAETEKVGATQEKYLLLLGKYVQWRYGKTEGSRIYPRVSSMSR